MAVNIDSYGMSRTYQNGNLVNNLEYDANYDGNHLNLALQKNNNDLIFMKMNNQEIKNLFNQPTHNKPIHERIVLELKPKSCPSSKVNTNTLKSRSRTKSKRGTSTRTRPRSKSRKSRPSKTRTRTRTKPKTRTRSRSNKKSYTRSIDKTFY